MRVETRAPEAYFRIADVEGRTARGRTSATFVRASETVSWLEPPSGEPARHTKLRLTRRVRSIAAERFFATGFTGRLVVAAYTQLQ